MSYLRPQGDTILGQFGGAYVRPLGSAIAGQFGDPAPVGTPAASLRAWNGSAWSLGVLRRWDGSAWVIATPRYWTGTAWLAMQ